MDVVSSLTLEATPDFLAIVENRVHEHTRDGGEVELWEEAKSEKKEKEKRRNGVNEGRSDLAGRTP
jgi:hypothetical protein